MTDDERNFLSAILSDPDNDVPRLAFADWMDDQAGRLTPRSELIRLQCAIARLPPEPRKLFVADGAGQMMEGLGVELIHHGDGHYSASTLERGLSTETFSPGERVDIYAQRTGGRLGWMRGLKYVKHVEEKDCIVFRKDADSKPWPGTTLKKRESALLAAHAEEWRKGPKAVCPDCVHWKGYVPKDCQCGGSRRVDTGGLLRQFDYPNGQYVTPENAVLVREPVHVTYNRGLKVVTVPRLADCVEEWNMAQHGVRGQWIEPITVRPTSWLLAVIQHHPDVEAIIALDRKPNQVAKPYWFDARVIGGHLDASHDLPHVLLLCLEGGAECHSGSEREYETAQLAILALARAIASWGRTFLTSSSAAVECAPPPSGPR